MTSYISSDHKELSKKYPEGYYLFASKKYTTIPSNIDIYNNFSIDWKNCQVKRITDSFLYIYLKSFYYFRNKINFKNLHIVLERNIGSVAYGIFIDNIGFFVELLDKRKDEIIYVIGFRKVKSIPKKTKLDKKVVEFIKTSGIKGYSLPPLVINRSSGLIIEGLIISSGSESY